MGQFSELHKHQILPTSELPVQAMPALDNQKLIAQEENRRKSIAIAPKFAHPISVDYNVQKSDAWESIGDQSIWRLVIESKDAYSLNLGFSKFLLPSSASLYIYDFYGKEQIRPFVSSDNDVHEQLWAPLIASDKIVIEINIKTEEIEDLQLVLNYVNHDFMDVQKSITSACHIDVSCGSATGYPGVDEYRDQIRSVGLFTIAGTTVCTGFLINNTRQDCTPYFMTASHCNLNANNVASMVTYWNYENSYCRQPGSYDSAEDGDGGFSQFNSGAIWRSDWRESDFTLVELDDAIPEEANPYFCGWDISSNLPSRGVTIHHPNLEEKRISIKYSSLYLGQWGQEATPIANGNHFIVNTWDLGSTEEGSSGAPLFNRQGLVVGQLHGGLANCENNDYDAFGRLFSSWTGGGMPSNRLRDWLDPDNLGVLNLPGKNCVFNIELSNNDFTKCSTDGFFEIEVRVSESFQGPVALTFEGLPNGAFAFFEQTTINPGQTTKLVVSNLENLVAESYSFDIVARDQAQTIRTGLTFSILSTIAEAPILMLPAQNSTIDISESLLIWNQDPTTNIYRLEIARDENFTDLLVSQVLSENFFDASDIFMPNQAYYYRVKRINLCGESEWSTVYQFLAVNLFCVEDQNATIQEISDGAPSIILVPILNEVEGSVMSVQVTNIQGEHSFVSDLRFSLISPEGTEVLLVGDKCSFTENFNLGFSDDGEENFVCPLTAQTTYKPLQALSTFKGESAQGNWNLKVEDRNTFDGGVLQSWSLEICVNSSDDFRLFADVETLNMCTNETYNLPLTLGTGFDRDADLTFDISNPNIAEITESEDGIIVLINPTGNISPGNYPIEISVSDVFGNKALYDLDIIIIDNPTVVELVEPADQTVLPNQNHNLTWSVSTFAQEYILSIGEDENFDNEIFRDTTDQTNYTLPDVFSSNQIYYWKITSRNRCGQATSETRNFSVEQTNSTQSTGEQELRIYPNPAKQYIFIEAKNNTVDEVKLLIHSTDGKLVYENQLANLGSSTKTIPVTNWPRGVYIISTYYQTHAQISRIVIQ